MFEYPKIVNYIDNLTVFDFFVEGDGFVFELIAAKVIQHNKVNNIFN